MSLSYDCRQQPMVFSVIVKWVAFMHQKMSKAAHQLQKGEANLIKVFWPIISVQVEVYLAETFDYCHMSGKWGPLSQS